MKTIPYRHLLQASLALSGLFLCPCCKSDETLATAGTINGTLPLSEISGASMLGNHLLLVSDDPEDEDDAVKKYHMVVLLRNAVDRVKGKTTITLEDSKQIYKNLLDALKSDDAQFITDLEDVALSPKAGIAYLISSHSRSKGNKLPDKRQRLIRVEFDPSSGNIVSATPSNVPILSLLPENLKGSTDRKTDAATDDSRPNPGFNIEGMACDGDDLLLGLRSPKVGESAIVLRLTQIEATFGKAAERAKVTVSPIELNLEGKGIRGLFHDPEAKGWWIIAGLSEDPEKGPPPNDWTIWFWDGKKLQPKFRKADFARPIHNPEALCIIGNATTGRSLLIVSDDGKQSPPGSAYALVPLEKLVSPP